MKLIEHLEYTLGLVDKSAPYSQIKGSLLAMREEVEGYEQAAANQVALAQKNQELIATIAKLKEEQPTVPGKLCPYCRKNTGQFLGYKPSPHPPHAMLGIRHAFYKCSNPQCANEFDEEVA